MQFFKLLAVLKDKPVGQVDKKVLESARQIVEERFVWLERHQAIFEKYFLKKDNSATSIVSPLVLIAAVVIKSLYFN